MLAQMEVHNMNNDGQKTANQYMIRLKFFSIKAWTDALLRDCRARELSTHTVEYYRVRLAHFEKCVVALDVIEVMDITPASIR
jgi:hypothetical protein